MASDLSNVILKAELTARCDTTSVRTLTPKIFGDGTQLVQERQKFTGVDAMAIGRPRIDYIAKKEPAIYLRQELTLV
jgi:hypothetical protein